MAAPANTPSKGGFLGKLNPKQKRLLAIGAIAVVLAVAYVLMRGRGQEGEPRASQQPAEGEAIAGSQFGGPVGYAGGENAAALSSLSENLGSELGILGEQAGATQQMVGEGNAEVAGLAQSEAEFQGTQGEANERFLGLMDANNTVLQGIAKTLEHRAKSGKAKAGGGRKKPGEGKKAGAGKAKGKAGKGKKAKGGKAKAGGGKKAKGKK